MAAQTLAERGKQVMIIEQKPAAARKFLVAGHGGFNLTHNMDYAAMLQEYTPNNILPYITHFTNKDTITWLDKIGIPTYVGSSGKVFPAKDIKPIQVLQAWIKYLAQLPIQILYQHELIDFDNQKIEVLHQGKTLTYNFEKLILTLGGASWPQTGATGKWVQTFKEKDIDITPLAPANTGFETVIDFSNLAGQVLKNVQISFHDQHKLGEFVFTTYGIEGSPIYYFNRHLRGLTFPQTLHINFKPQNTYASLLALWLKYPKKNSTQKLKDVYKLSSTAIALLKLLPKETYTNEERLLQAMLQYPISISGYRPIEEAISSAGGVAWTALNEDLSLIKYPNVHCLGEMLDWEAPTGGFLLQACFAMGNYLGNKL